MHALTAAGTTANGQNEDFHVILVEPQESLNVGSVARAMMNLGFRHLHLVAPRGYSHDRARITACWAEPLLDSLTIHDTFPDALADMEDAVGLSLRYGRNPAFSVMLPEWTATLPGRQPRRTALVFGPEDNGLRREHVDLCRYVIRIPSAEDSPTFNLAQSVLIVLWELTKTLPAPPPGEGVARVTERPTGNDLVQLDRLVDSVMTESGFVRPGSPEPTPGLIKNLLRRMDMDKHEAGVLMALFGRVNTALRQRRE